MPPQPPPARSSWARATTLAPTVFPRCCCCDSSLSREHSASRYSLALGLRCDRLTVISDGPKTVGRRPVVLRGGTRAGQTRAWPSARVDRLSRCACRPARSIDGPCRTTGRETRITTTTKKMAQLSRAQNHWVGCPFRPCATTRRGTMVSAN
jgi:hypothetical protein